MLSSSPSKFLFCPADPSRIKGFFPDRNLSSHSTHSQLHWSGPSSIPFTFPSFFHLTQLCRDVSCPFRCQRSSASVYQVLCKFGKLSSGHRTGKGQFSFQSQRKAMPKNAQTPQFKSINSLALSFLHSPTLTSIHDHWKNHSLD